MTTPSQLQKIQELYTSNLKEKGKTSSAVGWNTPECQALRFEKLSSFIDSHSYSVNDYGCGYGAHLRYLQNELGHTISAYNGYDISQQMLDMAEKEHEDYNGTLNLFNESSIRTQADYSFVSGTFNVRFDATTQEWETFILEKLEEMNRFSNKGFSFNLLTSYVDWEEPHLYYGDPCKWFDICKKKFSKHVNLLHDYPLWEWTITVKK